MADGNSFGKIFVAIFGIMRNFLEYMAATIIVTVFSLSLSAQVKTNGKSTDIDGVVRLDKTIHDFGDVMLSQGSLSCTFTVTNISKKPIVIYNVVSSCGCTAVKWTREPILPGKTGTISTTYTNDEGPYPFDKTLTAYISDVKKPIVLRLRGVAHDKKLSLAQLYPEHRGALALKKTDIKLGNLIQGGQRGDAVNVANIGTIPAKISFTDITPGLQISVYPNPIPPGKSAKMSYIVTADRNKWGKNKYYATPIINGQKSRPISVWTFTIDDFSSWTAEQQNNASQPIFDSSSYDFGKVRRGTKLTATFTAKNLGGSTFHVYKADTDTKGITIPVKFGDIASGADGTYKFGVDTSSLPAGDNDIIIILTTNCPLRPIINLSISGTIE